jgi:DHA1 family multidrug resistance protein-like MFS transporter
MSVATEPYPDQSREWVRLTGLFAVASFSEIILFSNLAAFTPVYLLHLGFGDASVKFWTGFLASVGMLLGFWFVPMWGVLADRYGRKPLIVRSFAVEIAACVLMALAPNIWVFTLGRMLTGLALGNTGLMFASLSEHAPRRRIGLAIALVTGSQPLGGVLGSFIGGYIVSSFGILALWWFDTLLIAMVFGMLVLFYHEPLHRRVTLPIYAMVRNALRAIVTTPLVVKYFIFSFAATSGYFFAYPFLSTRIIELANTPDVGATIGLVFGIAGIATLIATPLWGTLADKMGHARLLPVVTLLTAAAYLPLYFASSVSDFTLFYFILSAFSPAINGLTFAIIGLYTPADRRNAVMSMLYMPLNAAIIVAPTISGLVTTEVRQIFLLSFAALLASFLLLLLTRGSAAEQHAP